MSAFPIDAALEGFRFTREHPRAIAVWGGLSFVGWLAGASILIATGAESAMAGVRDLSPTDPAAVEAIFAALPTILPGMLIYFALSLVLFAVLACSALRAMLREPGAATLRLGADELRMMGLMLSLAGINLAILLGVSAVAGFAVLAAGGPASRAGQIVAALAQLGALALQGLVMVRLALASPLSVAERRFSLAESWRRTRGRFWSLLGALVLAALLYMVVAFLMAQLFLRLAQIVSMAIGGGQPGPGLAQLAHPAVLVVQVGLALAFALGVPILAGPLAFAYRSFGTNTVSARPTPAAPRPRG